MKRLVVNLVKSTLVVALVLASSSIYAVGDVTVAPIEGSKKARVSVAPDQSANVRLTVLDENGTEYLYSEDLNSETSYNKVYDFNLLEEGAYKIVAESDSKIIEKNITVSKGGVTLVGENEKYKPYFNLKGSKLIISYLNNESKDVSVSFSDRSKIFFSDDKSKEINFMKAYSLAGLEQGEYVVSLNSGDKSYSYYFEVK